MADQDQSQKPDKDKDKDKEEVDRSGLWFGLAMCGGIALLMIIGYLGRGSVTL